MDTLRGLCNSFAGQPLYGNFNLDLQRYPRELSGGQMQTVCILRSLAPRPTRIAEIVPFDLPRPPAPEAVSDPEFVRVKVHTLEVFRHELNA